MKIFNPLEGLLKTIFKGQPNIFSVDDLNRYFDKLLHQSNLLEESLGSTTVNLRLVCNSVTTSSTNLIFNITLSAIDINEPTYLLHKGVKIELTGLLGTFPITVPSLAITANNIDVSQQLQPLFIYLFAKKGTVTFNTAANTYGVAVPKEFSGTTLTTLSTPPLTAELPTTDSEVWYDYKLYYSSSQVPTPAGYEYITTLGAVLHTEKFNYELTELAAPQSFANNRIALLLTPNVEDMYFTSKMYYATTEKEMEDALFTDYPGNPNNYPLFSIKGSVNVNSATLWGKFSMFYHEFNRSQAWQNTVLKSLITRIKNDVLPNMGVIPALSQLLNSTQDGWHTVGDSASGLGSAYKTYPSNNLAYSGTGPSNNSVRFKKVIDRVSIIGTVKSSFINPNTNTAISFPTLMHDSVLFILPVEYRPSSDRVFICRCFGYDSQVSSSQDRYDTCVVTVTSQGNVIIQWEVGNILNVYQSPTPALTQCTVDFSFTL
jgi:hypothetical protein